MPDIAKIDIYTAIPGSSEEEEYVLCVIRITDGREFKIRGGDLTLEMEQDTVKVAPGDDCDWIKRLREGDAEVSISMSVREHNDEN